MTEQQNTKVVQDAYAAFGKGDIPGVLALMSDDVDWHGVIGVGPDVPMRGPRRGHTGVGEFFQQVSEVVNFTKFEQREFVAQGDKVVVLGDYEGTNKKTGRSFVSDNVMVFTVRNGKIVAFREYMDASVIDASFRA
jgi:ketosteroid isomerase-like protein